MSKENKMNFDQSLEDIISSNITKFKNFKKTRSGRVVVRDTYRRDRRGYEGGYGGYRPRPAYRSAYRAAPYSVPSRREFQRQYENRFQDNRNERPLPRVDGILLTTGSGSSVKMYISNLDFGVTQGDMKELFGSVGKLKSANLHYDKNGRSQGTCEVFFERRSDAQKAFNQYNGVPLDGRPMCLELMGEPVKNQDAMRTRVGERAPVQQREQSRGYNKDSRDDDRRNYHQMNGNRNDNRSNRGYDKKAPPTAEDLDKQLDAYLVQGARA